MLVKATGVFLRDSTGLEAGYFAGKEIDLPGVREARPDDGAGGWLLKGLEALNQRYMTPFRYGEPGSPFEYNKVRYLLRNYRELLIAG